MTINCLTQQIFRAKYHSFSDTKDDLLNV